MYDKDCPKLADAPETIGTNLGADHLKHRSPEA
jgi:hypothetical protein